MEAVSKLHVRVVDANNLTKGAPYRWPGTEPDAALSERRILLHRGGAEAEEEDGGGAGPTPGLAHGLHLVRLASAPSALPAAL